MMNSEILCCMCLVYRDSENAMVNNKLGWKFEERNKTLFCKMKLLSF
jgi:hypothetical protein